jgi:hypothetical protein
MLAFLKSLFLSSDKTFLYDINHQAKQRQQAPRIAAVKHPFLGPAGRTGHSNGQQASHEAPNDKPGADRRGEHFKRAGRDSTLAKSIDTTLPEASAHVAR